MAKEMRDSLRDYRTIISMIVVPVLVIPLLIFGIGSFAVKSMTQSAQRDSADNDHRRRKLVESALGVARDQKP